MYQYRWLILLLLGVAFLLRVDFIFYILYVAAGIFLWSRWNTGRALQNITATREYQPRAFLGEAVVIKLTLSNKSRLSIPWVQMSETVPPELRLESQVNQVVNLRGRESHSITYQVRGQQRGYYQLGPLRLSSGDLFGLANPRFGTLRPGYLTIYPRIVPLARLGLISRLPFGTIASRQRLFEDPARPMGVREFRSGDSLRQMNWKASAHTQKLLVRTFEPAISLETLLLLDLHSSSYERRDLHYSVEWAIVTAASLASYLVNQRQAVGLSSNGIDPLRMQEESRVYDETTGKLLFEGNNTTGNARRYQAIPLETGTGRPHLMKLLEVLARLESRDTTPFTEWAPQACAALSWGVTVVAITAQGDPATCNTLHRLARSGFNPILIAIEPNANFGLVRRRARQLGFQAFNVNDRRDLSEWQRPASSFAAGAR